MHGTTVMPLLLDKVLTLLALPLGTVVGAGLLALAALVLGRRRIAGGLLAFAIVWLWGWSTPLATRAIIGPLTDPYPTRSAETSPAADAIVLLGGGITPIQGEMPYPNLDASTDRIWHAARLYHAGKAPLIIVSAGNVWGGSEQQSKAEAMRMLLDALGVPDDAIVTEGRSRNTRQNTLFTAELAESREIRRVLLTTSAWHMRRAEAAFRRTGLDVIPAATDMSSPSFPPGILRFLPGANRLWFNSTLLKEYLGYLIYRLRDWA